MGDQQQRFLEWFSGVLDGDGCITFRTRWQKNRFIQITPMVQITNTSKLLIDECANGLTELKIPFWITTKHPNGKTIYWLEISGLKRVAKLLPYLRVRAKRNEVDFVRKFTESRLRLREKKETPYTQEELNWVKNLAKIHTRKNAQRLYARLLKDENEDIVCSHGKP